MVTETSFHYWVHWPAVVCEVLLLIAVAAAILVIYGVEYRSWRKSGASLTSAAYIYDDGELWIPCWRCVSPKVFLCIRAACFLLLAGFMAADLAVHSYRIYFFYTEWTFTLVAIYFALATLVSFKGCYKSSNQGSAQHQDEIADFLKTDAERLHNASCTNGNLDSVPVRSEAYGNCMDKRKKTGCLGFLMQIIFQICGGAAMMTDIVFWGVLVPFMMSDHYRLNLLMASMHSLNLVFLLIDVVLSGMHFPFFRGAYFVLWTGAYVIFQWILHACGFSWWPYPFLELSTYWAPLWYLGMAVMCIVSYGGFYLIVKFKRRQFPKLFPNYYCTL